jgi:hypothetical protein
MSKSSYQKRIARLGARYPKASKSQLRGHPKKGERPLHTLKPQPVHKIPFEYLTRKEKAHRLKSLNVLAKVKRGKGSLSSISKKYGTTPKTVLRHTNGLKKVGYRWIGKRHDRIERIMRINENGYEVDVAIKDSRYASIIAKYQNAVKNFLETQDESYLEPFRGKQIKDSDGNWHTLDTDPDNIYNIQERRENEEDWNIYKE